jgi:hypothetical protein
VGGTGLFQICELYLQLTGEFPNPRAQARDARMGLSHSIGGPGNNVYVTLIERSDSQREPGDPGPKPARRAPVRAELADAPAALHGRVARIEAATTIYVTAQGGDPIHVALLSLGDRRVFAKFDQPLAADADPITSLAGQRARFLVKDDGDHYFQLVPDRRDFSNLLRGLVSRLSRD